MTSHKLSFPISFEVEDVIKLIESTIKDKFWHDFEVADVKLLYTPYFLFEYHTYTESDEEGSQKAVQDIDSGKLALNASTLELEEEPAFLSEETEPAEFKKPKKDYPFEFAPLKVSERIAERIIQLKVAQRFSLPKDNVVVSSVKLVFLPKWLVWVSVAEGNYELQVDAINGSVLNEEEVPEREKGWLEVTKETLEELKQPGAWVDYSKGIGSSVLNFLNTSFVSTFKTTLMFDRRTQIILLAVIAVIVIFWATGFL